MITTFYPPYHFGGDGTFIYRLSNGLARRGHEVEVIHCRDAYRMLQDKGAAPLKEYEHHPNVTVHGLESRAGALSPLWTQQMGSPGFKSGQIKTILDKGRFDVIHFHNISLVGGPKILEYGDAVKLYTTHEYWLVCPTHVLFKFNEAACEKPECLKCQLIYKRPPQMWRYTGGLEKAVKNVDAFISPSCFGVEAHARFGLDIPTVHLPHFVPPAPDDITGSTPANGGRPYFLFVGRLEKLKGVQEVLPLFQGNGASDFLVVGTGGYEAELRALAGDAKRIHFLGALPYEKVVELYKGATALIVPSLCYETFGQIVVEAFTLKTPVLVKDIGALRELVEQSDGGILYRNVEELRAAIGRLQAEPKLRDEMGQKGYAAYLKYWTEEQHFQDYFQLIDGLLEKKAASKSNFARS